MQHLKKIAGINLLILLAYTVIIFAVNVNGSGRSLGILATAMVVIGIHVFINVILAIIFFIQKDKERGMAFLLSSLIVLVIGFSSCFGSALLADEVSGLEATYMEVE